MHSGAMQCTFSCEVRKQTAKDSKNKDIATTWKERYFYVYKSQLTEGSWVLLRFLCLPLPSPTAALAAVAVPALLPAAALTKAFSPCPA